MTRASTFRLAPFLAAAVIGLSSPLVGCQREEKSLGDKARDAFGTREHEELKDAGEDVRDAVKDAADAVADEAESLTD